MHKMIKRIENSVSNIQDIPPFLIKLHFQLYKGCGINITKVVYKYLMIIYIDPQINYCIFIYEPDRSFNIISS